MVQQFLCVIGSGRTSVNSLSNCSCGVQRTQLEHSSMTKHISILLAEVLFEHQKCYIKIHVLFLIFTSGEVVKIIAHKCALSPHFTHKRTTGSLPLTVACFISSWRGVLFHPLFGACPCIFIWLNG